MNEIELEEQHVIILKQYIDYLNDSIETLKNTRDVSNFIKFRDNLEEELRLDKIIINKLKAFEILNKYNFIEVKMKKASENVFYPILEKRKETQINCDEFELLRKIQKEV